MLEPKVSRVAIPPQRFNPATARMDPAIKARLLGSRGLRAAQLLGTTTPYDLKTPWLTLRPDNPFTAGKGYIEYTSPSFIGMGNFEDGQYCYAGFDLIFQKQETGSYSIERPQLAIRLIDPPKPKMLVEIDIHAHDATPGDPSFEVNAMNNQTVTATDGQRSSLMFIMHDYFAIQSAWATGKTFYDRDGNWAFFEARITPID